MSWFVYMLRCGDGSLYTGVTNDLERRVAAHASGRGAAYTRGRGPFTVAHLEPAPDRSTALRRELEIKKMTRTGKEALMRRKPPAVPPSRRPAFAPAALTFLRGLARHNERAWFEAHRDAYEREVRGPLRELVEELDVRLATLAPEIVGDPKRSLFRIHRDVRFSSDKRPYKTHAAAWLYHRDAGKGVGREAAHGGAGFYFHLAPAPQGSLFGGGIWMPPRPTLALLRERLVEEPEAFAALVDAPAFRRRFGPLDTEGMLKRLPRGYAPGHPAERWLRYTSFFASRAVPVEEATSPRLADRLAKDIAALVPFVRWLNEAIGLQGLGTRY
ncbi:MAG TPA: TIGR02453 family protein [Gemmatimonadales bacterium]|nr:TIGR02453 family protein [Gemmatimonadales bacterium]